MQDYMFSYIVCKLCQKVGMGDKEEKKEDNEEKSDWFLAEFYPFSDLLSQPRRECLTFTELHQTVSNKAVCVYKKSNTSGNVYFSFVSLFM